MPSKTFLLLLFILVIGGNKISASKPCNFLAKFGEKTSRRSNIPLGEFSLNDLFLRVITQGESRYLLPATSCRHSFLNTRWTTNCDLEWLPQQLANAPEHNLKERLNNSPLRHFHAKLAESINRNIKKAGWTVSGSIECTGFKPN
tara:strand:- start:11129 stop:11563 length:435 start_codon:yes stop_codon:yes gene_type:complete